MVRRMTVDDAQAVWEIYVRSLGYGCELEVMRRRIGELCDDPRQATLVWEDEATGQVEAVLHAERYDTLHDEGGWNVIALGVAPEVQGQGIGRALLESFEDAVRQQGGQYVRLNSRVERTKAHGFYEHLGYTNSKVQKYFKKQL